ncbi:MAG: hypothetical protein J7485_05275 [Sphingobium sp.]|nr:hypothetical protein [Sphingobium sp.]
MTRYRPIISPTNNEVNGVEQAEGEKGCARFTWLLVRSDGRVDIKADYMLKTDDGVIIDVVNTGGAAYVQTRPVAQTGVNTSTLRGAPGQV